MKNKITLHELTGQESGVVIYDNGNTIICNWQSLEGLPYIVDHFGWLMDMENEIISVEFTKKTKNSSKYLREVIYDRNGDAQCLKNHPATIWKLIDGTIILAPEGWN